MFSQKQSDPASYIGPSPWRLFLAFCLFMMFIGVGGLILSRAFINSNLGKNSKQKSTPYRTQQTGIDSSAELLFYRAVGQSSMLGPSLYEHDSTLEEEISSLSQMAPSKKSSSDTPSVKSTNYTIELKKTTDRQEAEELVSSLQAKGIHAFYTPMLSNNFVIYRVRVGIYESKATAQKDLGFIKPHVTTSPLIAELK